jgi:DNA-binding NarL/FixJ family response regulator
MANELTVSERTIRFHLSNIYEKLGVSSRAEAISWALKRDARS